jgi:hypothetical protein
MCSPDGRWLAYVANNSGTDEIYVRPFPGPGDARQVSVAGGTTPTWSRHKNELIFRAPTNELMVIAYSVAGGVFRSDAPQRWSEGAIPVRPGQRSFDLRPNADRVVIAERNSDGATNRDHVTLITDGFNRLRSLAPSVP